MSRNFHDFFFAFRENVEKHLRQFSNTLSHRAVCAQVCFDSYLTKSTTRESRTTHLGFRVSRCATAAEIFFSKNKEATFGLG